MEWLSETSGLAALNVVTFGKECFTIKEEDELIGWSKITVRRTSAYTSSEGL
jgi:hypothetical protein